MPMDGAIPVPALIMLAGRLSGHAELGGDLRPSQVAEWAGNSVDVLLRI